MPSVKDWAASLAQVHPRRQSSLVGLEVGNTSSQQRPGLVAGKEVGPWEQQGSIERRVDYSVVQDDGCVGQFGNYTGVWAGHTADSAPQVVRSRYFGDHIHQSAYRK